MGSRRRVWALGPWAAKPMSLGRTSWKSQAVKGTLYGTREWGARQALGLRGGARRQSLDHTKRWGEVEL